MKILGYEYQSCFAPYIKQFSTGKAVCLQIPAHLTTHSAKS